MTINRRDNESADEVLARLSDLLMMIAGGNDDTVQTPDTAPLKNITEKGHQAGKLDDFDDSLLRVDANDVVKKILDDFFTKGYLLNWDLFVKQRGKELM